VKILLSKGITEKIIDSLQNSIWGLTIEEISKVTGYHRNTISKYMQELEKIGLVVKKSTGKYTFWLPRNVYNYYKTGIINIFLEGLITYCKKEISREASVFDLGRFLAKFLFSSYEWKKLLTENKLRKATDLRSFLGINIPTIIPGIRFKIMDFEFTDKLIYVTITGCPCSSIDIETVCEFFRGYIAGTMDSMNIKYKSINTVECEGNSKGRCHYSIILEKSIAEQLRDKIF